MQCYRCGTNMVLKKDESYHCPECKAVCSYDYGEEKEGKIKKKAGEIAALVEEKNKAYGNSFGESEKILKVLYPEGIKPEQYKDVLTIARILDKLFRVVNHHDYAGESPYEDIVGYALLAATNR